MILDNGEILILDKEDFKSWNKLQSLLRNKRHYKHIFIPKGFNIGFGLGYKPLKGEINVFCYDDWTNVVG